MNERPTVQMDSYPEEESQRGTPGTPPTIPIDDLFLEQEWPSPSQDPTPVPFGAPPATPQAPPAGPAGERCARFLVVPTAFRVGISEPARP